MLISGANFRITKPKMGNPLIMGNACRERGTGKVDKTDDAYSESPP